MSYNRGQIAWSSTHLELWLEFAPVSQLTSPSANRRDGTTFYCQRYWPIDCHSDALAYNPRGSVAKKIHLQGTGTLGICRYRLEAGTFLLQYAIEKWLKEGAAEEQ